MLLALLIGLGCDKDRFITEDDLLVLDMDADGHSIADGDCNDQNPAVHPDAPEACDGVNNDCDDAIDEGTGSTWYLDVDQDGYGDPEVMAWACAQPQSYVPEEGDCNDNNPAVHPDAEEACNSVDDNCDGQVDEGVMTQWFTDGDGDGYGAPDSGQFACDAPEGTVNNDFDCDDQDALANALALDVCDGADNDCDGEVDEDPDLAWYGDGDGDGYGDDATLSYACIQPEGLVFHGGDCDDSDANLSPAAAEVCDGIDNDCDGAIDPDTALDAPIWFLDDDGDGWGDASSTTASCLTPPGYVADSTDCDDGDASIRPDASEYCDGIDNDCDMATDEDDSVDAATWYADVDNDGFGDAANPHNACTQPSDYVADNTDCDDSRDSDYPGADEYCDGRDNDCDGDTDEEGALDEPSWYADGDEDGFGDSSDRLAACTQPTGYVSDDTDCDDSEATTNPDAVEYCDSVDNDCDGSTDEDDAADALTWYLDDDGDGYGAQSSGTTVACDQPSGYGDADDDCDDTDSTISPASPEVCSDGIDDDCDGTADNGCPEEHCGYLSSDETWSSSVDHTITCDVLVYGGATLTIEDGSTVYMEPGTELTIGYGSYSVGTLEADGSSSGITFTSSESSPAAGDWERIHFARGASSSSTLNNVTIEYGGNTNGNLHIDATIDIEDCTVTDSADAGIYVGSYGVAGVTGCTVQDNAGSGVEVDGSLATTGGPTFTDNVISSNGGYPVELPAYDVGQIDSSNTLTGNTHDFVLVTADVVAEDTTWSLVDVDYQIEGDVDVHGTNIPVLTIEDGVSLYFDPGTGLRVGDSYWYDGALSAEGNTSGITFSSSESSPGAGDWDGLLLGERFYDADSDLVGLTIEYAGYTGFGGLRVDGADTSLEDSTIQDNDVSGIYIEDGVLEVSGSTIQDNLGDGIYCAGDLGDEASFTNNTVTGNDDHPVRLGPDQVKALDATSSFTGNGEDTIYIRYGDGAVNDTGTWQALDVDYYLSQTIVVRGSTGAVLTLDDGVTVYVAAGQSLDVGKPWAGHTGGLIVDGHTNGVTLTSAESSPAAGDWDGLWFGNSNLDNSSDIDGLTIEYAGDNGYGCVYLNDADVDLTNSTVQDCSNNGIYADDGSELGLSNSTVQDNEDYGVYAWYLNTTGGPTFTNNTITANGAQPVRVSAKSWHQLDNSSSYTGNSDDTVRIASGVITLASTTIQLLDVDYHVVEDVYIGDGTGTVDVADGVTFYNDPGVRWTVGWSGSGDLTAVASTGITWTSSQATPAEGDWEGLYITSGSSSTELNGVTVEYGGDSLGGNVYCYFSNPVVENSTLAYSSGYGLYAKYCSSATFSNNTYIGNLAGDTN